MLKIINKKLSNLFLLLMCLFCFAGCATISRKVVDEKTEQKTDAELQRKLDEWTDQLHSNEPTIRSSAAVSLLGLNLHNAQDPLLRILKDNKEREDVQISVIKAFGFTKDGRATDILIDLLDSDSVLIQTAASETLGVLKTRDSIRKMSEAMLNPKRTINIKILLAKALGNTNDRDAVEPLIKMLAANDSGLRDVAKRSLEKITKQADGNDSAWWKEWWIRNKSKTREQWLEDIVLKQEENAKQQEAIVEQLKLEIAQKSIKLLELLPDRNDPKPLIEAIKSDYPDVRIFAAKELVKIKDPSVISVLINAISDKEEEVRVEAVQALGEIGDDSAVEPLIYALDDESIVIREKAAKSLGLLGKSRAADALIQSLDNNSNLSIICSVIEALGQIGDTMAVRPLAVYLTHKESKIRECTAAALGKLHDSLSVKLLINVLNDEQERVRWYAADSLGKIGDESCVEALTKLLSDSSARVRESAVTALGQIGNQQSVEFLIKTLQDVDKRVAEQAAESLVNIKNMSFETMDILATTFFTNKDYKKAQIILERKISEYSSQPEYQEKIMQAKFKLAEALFALKEWQKALTLYEELIKRFSNDDTIKMELIQCLKEMKQYERTLEWYTSWMKESPQNSQIYWQGRLDIASTMFEQDKFDNVKDIIEGFKTEDKDLGGEQFKQQFQRLSELCMAELSNAKELSQSLELDSAAEADSK